MSGVLLSSLNTLFNQWRHSLSQAFLNTPRLPGVSASREFNPNQEEEAIDTFGEAIDDFEQVINASLHHRNAFREVIDAFEEVVNAYLHHRFALRSARFNRIIRLTQIIIEQLPEDGSSPEPNQDPDHTRAATEQSPGDGSGAEPNQDPHQTQTPR